MARLVTDKINANTVSIPHMVFPLQIGKNALMKKMLDSLPDKDWRYNPGLFAKKIGFDSGGKMEVKGIEYRDAYIGSSKVGLTLINGAYE